MTDPTPARPQMTSTAPEALRSAPVEPERQLPAEAETAHGLPDYEDPRQARAEIEATRARMSDTIDEIEDVLVRKKEHLQDRLDVLAPVRENPWPSVGIALGAGLLLGLLTGGDDEPDDAVEPGLDWERRAGILEARTRRLLAIAREQEDQIARLQRSQQKRSRRRRLRQRTSHRLADARDELAGRADTAVARLDELRELVQDGVTSFLRDSLRQFTGRR